MAMWFCGQALACKLATAERSAVLATYVENAWACLAAPQDPLFEFRAKLEDQFIQKVNAERVSRDLAPLQVRVELRPAARFHSLDMGYNDFFGHDTPYGRSHLYRVSALDRTLLAAGSAENVAKFGPVRCRNSLDQLVSCASAPGYKPPSAEHVVNDLHRKLMNSDGHRQNILDPAMTHIAVGVAYRDTGYYVSQLFVRPAGRLERPLPLRFAAGAPLDIAPLIPGWQIARIAVARDKDPQDLTATTLPMDAIGDYTLYVRAEQTVKRDTERGEVFSSRWMYPTGPGFTVTPSTESRPLR